MIKFYLDPLSSQMHARREALLSSYTPRNGPPVLPNGVLEREHAEVVRSLKPGNMYVLKFATGYYLQKVVKVLKKLGYDLWLPRDQSV